jgi:hypothetical protein
MVNYYAARMTNISKHAAGHRGQKAATKAHRRKTIGSAKRRRHLAARKLAMASRVSVADAVYAANHPKFSSEGLDGNQDQ